MNRKSLLVSIIAIAVVALLIFAFIQGRAEFAKEKEREAPVKAPSRVTVVDSEPVVTLDKETQSQSGITVAALKPNTYRQEQQAYATVLQVQDLSDARNSYATAQAQLGKAQASLDAARQEYQRLDQLHNDDHNVSDKAFQAGLAALRTEEANVRAAQTAVQSSANSVIQRYGESITSWLAADTPTLKRLLQQQDVLIQVTLPASAPNVAPAKTIRIQMQENTFVTASLVSRSPRIDPRIQGISFFYLAAARMLIPGMNVLAYLPTHAEIQGVIVPQSAVVWWQGKAWIYAQKDDEHFVRREVPTDQPVENGFIVGSGLMPNATIVIGGAQLLLSEEFRSQIQVGEEGASK
jgi:hypothetical protein